MEPIECIYILFIYKISFYKEVGYKELARVILEAYKPNIWRVSSAS